MPFDRNSQGTLNTARGAARPQRRAVPLPDLWGDLAALPPGPDWTPKEVGDQLVEALRWARYAAGRTGPGAMTAMRLPYTATLDLHLEEGWGLPERADEDEGEELRLPPSPAQVTRHLAALQWSADYLCPGHVGSARTVGLWAACKAYKRSFAGAVKARGVPRVHAYRLRDRALSIIAQGLTRDRVPVAVD